MYRNKTENISFRTTLEVRQSLEEYSNERHWKLSHTVEEIILAWLEHQKQKNRNDSTQA